MPRTKLDRQAETIRDPCRPFRQILKRKQYADGQKMFSNKDISAWTNCCEGNISAKMNGKRDFSVREIRQIMEHVEFSRDEKAAVLG